MEYHDLHIFSFDWCNGIAISARAHDNLSNKGEMVQFNRERTIVLNPKKHLTLNRILCFCFNLHFLPLFRTTFNPFLPDLHQSLTIKIGRKEKKKTEICSFLSFDAETCKTSMLQSSPLSSREN